MSRLVHLPMALFIAVCFWASWCMGQEPDELGRKLQRINSLRAGTRTPLPLVQEKCDALLKEYTAPEEQGPIYYLLTLSYGTGWVSANGNAAKVIEYAQKALKCPLDPSRRLRLYIYWGDAIMLSDLTRPIAARRSEAAPVYLQGLKEAKQYNIPDVAPERPPIFLPTPGMNQETFRRERAARTTEHFRVLKVQELHRRRDGLQHQLLYDYARKPRAPDELRKLATEVLGAGPDVEKLMAALAAKCERVDKRLEP